MGHFLGLCSVDDSFQTLWRVEHSRYLGDDVDVTGQAFEWGIVTLSGKNVQCSEQVRKFLLQDTVIALFFYRYRIRCAVSGEYRSSLVPLGVPTASSGGLGCHGC